MQRVAGPAAKFCAGSSTKGLSLASACQIAPPGSETETRCRGCKGIKLRKGRGGARPAAKPPAPGAPRGPPSAGGPRPPPRPPQARRQSRRHGLRPCARLRRAACGPQPAPCTDQKRSSPARLPGPGNKTSLIRPHSGRRFAVPDSPACSDDKCRPHRRNIPPERPWPQVRHGRPRSPFR